jgi:hypothetical protein
MPKYVDPGVCTQWYQQLPYVEATLIPVRERSPNTLISLEQAFIGGGIGRLSTI